MSSLAVVNSRLMPMFREKKYMLHGFFVVLMNSIERNTYHS